MKLDKATPKLISLFEKSDLNIKNSNKFRP